MRKIDEMTRQELIDLMASDYGFGPNTTNKLTTETLRDTCKHAKPYLYLSSLIEVVGSQDIYLPEYQKLKE